MQGKNALRFHQKYLHLCTKDELTEGLTGLEQHEDEWLMTEFSFLGELSFLGLAFNGIVDPKTKIQF